MSPDQYLTKWALTAPAKLCETPTSHVYQVLFQGEAAILKVLTALGQKHEAKAARVLEYFDGVGAARLYKADEGAHLLEHLPGRHLKDLVWAGHGAGHGSGCDTGYDLEATEIVCAVLNKLHERSREMPKGPLPELTSMRENFRALFALSSKPSAGPLFVKGAEVAEHLLKTEDHVRVLHGDIHHTNILESEDRGWVAIDPHCLLGERTYDTANTFFNPDDLPSFVESSGRIRATCEVFSKHLSLEPKRILDFAFAYGCLSAAWCVEDGQSPERRLHITRLIEALREQCR